MKRTTLGTVAAVIGLMAVGGCGPDPAPSASPTATPSSTNPTQSAVDDALHSYYLARQTLAAMEENPKKTLGEYPASLKITDHIADPLLTEEVKNAAESAAEGWSFKTQMALSTPKTVSVDLAKKTVVLRHCGVDEKTTAYSYGKEADLVVAPGAAPPPHLMTFTMVQLQGQWKMTKLDMDGKTTCRAD